MELGDLARVAIMATPGRRGTFRQEAEDLFAQVACVVRHQPKPVQPTTLMAFLRDGGDEAECHELVAKWFGDQAPVTTCVVQPPCDGAALGVELWCAGGAGVVRRHGKHLVVTEANGVRWLHCGGLRGDPAAGPYEQSLAALRGMEQQLAAAGIGFDQVVRAWIYVNQITEGADGRQRYQEFNRARTDFFGDIAFGARRRAAWAPETIYPASTGIGTQGAAITMACLALDTERPDVFLVPLENPQQTPAYAYDRKYSPQTPKFSRAMAVVQGPFVTTLVSGTASIVNAQTVHVGDVARQTEQVLENIERLIAPANFARHGLPGSGATLADIAKIRVYVKHPQDYPACRAICERRLPGVPALYLHADVCRPDLLVEIEAVAFSASGLGAAAPGKRSLDAP